MVKKEDNRTNSRLQKKIKSKWGIFCIMNSRHFRKSYVESYGWAMNADTAKWTSTEKMYKQHVIHRNNNIFASS